MKNHHNSSLQQHCQRHRQKILTICMLMAFSAPAMAQSQIEDKTDLGTLKADNSGGSEVYALSADGAVAAGWADDDTGNHRATVWRLRYPNHKPPVVSPAIDVAQSMQSMAAAAAPTVASLATAHQALCRL